MEPAVGGAAGEAEDKDADDLPLKNKPAAEDKDTDILTGKNKRLALPCYCQYDCITYVVLTLRHAFLVVCCFHLHYMAVYATCCETAVPTYFLSAHKTVYRMVSVAKYLLPAFRLCQERRGWEVRLRPQEKQAVGCLLSLQATVVHKVKPYFCA